MMHERGRTPSPHDVVECGKYALGDFIYSLDPKGGVVVGRNGEDGSLRVINDLPTLDLIERILARRMDIGAERQREGDTNEHIRLPGPYGIGCALGSAAIAMGCHLAGVHHDSPSERAVRDVLLAAFGGALGMVIEEVRARVRSGGPSAHENEEEEWLREIVQLLNGATPLTKINSASDPLPDCSEQGTPENPLYTELVEDGEPRSVRRRDEFFKGIKEHANASGMPGLFLGKNIEDVFEDLLLSKGEFVQNDPRYMPAVIELLEARQRALDAYDIIKARVRAAQARQRQGIALPADEELLGCRMSDRNSAEPFGGDEIGQVNREYQQAWLKFIDIYARVQHAYHFKRLHEEIVAMLPETTQAASDHEFPVIHVIWDELSRAAGEITEPSKENVALLGDIKDTIATLPKTLPFAELYELYEKIYHKFAPRLRTLMTPSEFRRTYPGVADGVV